jgi:hypothetical protein
LTVESPAYFANTRSIGAYLGRQRGHALPFTFVGLTPGVGMADWLAWRGS